MLQEKTINQSLTIEKIYLEPEVYNYERGREILANYEDAELIEVPSHWKISELHGNEGSISDWTSIKK